MMEKQYGISKEDCQKQIDKHSGVCPSCGGTLTPIETVDNSDNPTFWAGCIVCCEFSWGVTLEVFRIADNLVREQGHVEYSHLGSIYDRPSEEKAYWYRSQIRGTCSLVSRVLNTQKKFASEIVNG